MDKERRRSDLIELAVKIQLGKLWALELCKFQTETGRLVS